MSQPVIVEETSHRLVIEIRPSVRELRGRVARLAFVSAVLFVVLLGFSFALHHAVTGGNSPAGPFVASGFLAGTFVAVRIRRLSATESLVLDRGEGLVVFRSELLPPGRLPRPIRLELARDVRVDPGASDYRRDVVLVLADDSTVTCFSLAGRRISPAEAERSDASLAELADRMRRFLSPRS